MVIKTRDVVRNFSSVFLTNVLTLVVGFVTALLVPKILSVDDYGDYKIFTLYLSYIGLFHFGLIDGIAVKYAGKTIDELQESILGTLTKKVIQIEGVVSLLFFIISLIVFRGVYKFIFCIIAIDILLHNIISFYSTVLQITSLFSKFAQIGFYSNILRLIGVLVLYFLSKYYVASAQEYILIFLISEFLQLFIYIIVLRGVLLRKKSTRSFNLAELFKLGTPLLISGLIGTLILNMDRQFVSILFSKHEYAVYSFAYNIINLLITLITSLSIVLYPSIKKLNESELEVFYKKGTMIMFIISFGCLSFIPLVGKFISWFLPQYTESIVIIYLITPIVTSLSIIQVFIINFFKSVEKTMEYFKISIVVLIISFIGNLIAAHVLRSINAITIASVISSYIWMIIANSYIQKCFNRRINIYIYPAIMTFFYYLIYNMKIINNEFIMAFFYFLVYSIFSVFFFIRSKRMKYGETIS